MKTSKHAALDAFRLAAAFLVVAIHVSPLENMDTTADFILTRVIARIAVPFFLMLTGYFMYEKITADRPYLGAAMKKTAVLYGAAILLYLPLNMYNGYFGSSPIQIVKDLLFNGTLYHLWYLPALLFGLPVTCLLWRSFGPRTAFALAVVLYAVGLGGDSYYGLALQVPGLGAFYNILFQVTDYTRNGFFFAPVFLAMGGLLRTRAVPLARNAAITGLSVAGVLLLIEALWLHRSGFQRHDSMYLMLLPVMFFLFSLLLRRNAGSNLTLRQASMIIYIVHPWSIVLVRAAAKLTGLTAVLVDNRLMLYLLVCALSFAIAMLALRILAAVRPPQPSATGRAWIEISRGALCYNAAALQALLPPSCRLMAVVKADAYGHGAATVAGILEKTGVRTFAVATLGEGIALRRHGIKGDVLILGYTGPSDAGCLKRYRLIQTIVDGAYARALNDTGVSLDVHIKLDTGMHRLGVDSGDLAEIESIFACSRLRVKGMFTHLSEADSLSVEGMDHTLGQISRFIDTVNTLRARGYEVGSLHIQESYGILNYPELPCDFARAGIALYGVLCKNDETHLKPELQPVLSLKARIAEVKQIRKGDAVSYARSFVAAADMKIAAVTIGYADGIPRNPVYRDGYVLVSGRKAPIIGLICMDALMIDVTGIENVRPGDVVTLIGRDGGEIIRCEDVAESCGTITNELLSRLGPRLPRLIV